MENNNLEAISACTLNRIFGYKPQISHQLISKLGSASAVFSLSKGELKDVFGPFNPDVDLINDRELDISAAEIARIEAMGAHLLTLDDPSYPQALAECEDAPICLYVRSGSNIDSLFNSGPYISIVGTRDISLYGKEWCERLVVALSRCRTKPVIVSGFALGVDICAHMAAISCGLPTIAVLPCGIDSVYPGSHHQAADRLLSTQGSALVTDFPTGFDAIKVAFLRRNRIIAGMSRSTILIESKKKGGGMMTARLAFDYGREVFALPGRLDDLRSQGCNILIKEKIAEPIVDIDQLPTILGLTQYEKRALSSEFEAEVIAAFEKTMTAADLADLTKAALKIKKVRGISVEEICATCKMDYSRVIWLTGLLAGAGFITVDLMQRCSIVVKKV